MTDRISKERRSWNMSRIKGKNTKPEILLRSLLHRAGYRFRLHLPHLPGKPDLVLPKYKTVIFVHGCFWHRHKGCYSVYTPKTRIEFWQDKFNATMERDNRKQAELEKEGWRVIIVWECELKSSEDEIISRIEQQLKIF